MHGPNPGYKPGDHWVQCPRCTFDWYASQMKKLWYGTWVCPDCWEPKHPGLMVRSVPDDQNPPEPVYPPQDPDVDVSKPDSRLPDVPSSTFNN